MIKKITQDQLIILKDAGISIDCLNNSSGKSAALILDKLSDLLVEKGLKENDEPNEYGLKIELLIDIFNREIYS